VLFYDVFLTLSDEVNRLEMKSQNPDLDDIRSISFGDPRRRTVRTHFAITPRLLTCLDSFIPVDLRMCGNSPLVPKCNDLSSIGISLVGCLCSLSMVGFLDTTSINHD
jgi:hypothetical protein